MKTKTLIISALLSLSLTAYAEGDFQRYMQEAGKAFKAQESEQALTALAKAEPFARTNTEKAKVNNAMGWTYFSDGNNEKAKQHLQQALTLSAESGNTRSAEKASNNLGVVEYTAGNLDEAEGYFLNKWSKESETSIRYLELIKQQRTLKTVNSIIAQGVTYTLDKNYVDAIAEYDKALVIEPNNVRALEYKGYAHYRLNNYAEAITALKKAQTIKPEQFNVLINLMKAYCASDKTDISKQLIEDNKTLLTSNSTILHGDGELQKICGQELFSAIVEQPKEEAVTKP
jgi:tetratricopeptide (TPR) repeat protein